jgi:hypothetical protein
MENEISVLIGNLTVGGIPLVGIIIGLVALGKLLGVPKQYAPYLNGALSVMAYLVVGFLQQYPVYTEITKVVVFATAIFLASSGVYQLSKTGPAKSR